MTQPPEQGPGTPPTGSDPGAMPPPQAPPPGQPNLPPPTTAPPPAVRQGNPNTISMLCHLLSLSALVGVPFGHVVGPLIVWLMKKDEFPEVDAHGKESLNFQISISIYFIVVGIMTVVLSIILIGLIGIPILIGMAIAWIVLVIVASVKANEGGFYKYPATIRFLT
jgi:uncharacterized Tic20 family protein